MKINQTVSNTSPAAPAKDATSPAAQTPRQAATGGPAGAAASNTQPLDLSVQTMQRALASQPEPINMARVEEIRAAIREGRLVINPEGIADAAMQAAFELIDRSGSTR